jgi:hypothetical protein
MTKWHQPSGLSSGLPFKVDSNWTPEQALAVWELLDDLRDRVGTHYGSAIAEPACKSSAIPINRWKT